MCGLIDDITSVFSGVGDAISSVFSGGSSAADAASAASDAASAASSATDVASNVPAGFNFATDAAGTAASSGDAISNAASYLDNSAAASYTAGMATGSWGALDTASSLAPGSSYLGSTAYDAINNGEFNASTFSGLDPNAPAYTNMALATANMGPTAAQAAAGQGWFSKAWTFMFGGGSPMATDPTGLGSLSHLMMGQMIGGLLSGAVQAYGAYKASLPRPPANFSGRSPGGGGAGLGMSTNGFGLTAGGSTPPPTGVPSQLQPNPQAERLGGSGGLAPVAPPNGAPNLQQTVANGAGVGGLIPQGSVNYMKGPTNG